MANSALERVLAAVNNGQRGNSSDLSSFISNYAQTSRKALETQRKQNEESALRGQQIIEAQKARDIINKAASNTAATYDFAHGQLPSISNAQAFQNAQRQTSLDDSLNQIMGNNVLTDAGRVSKAQEAYSSILSAPTVGATPTAQEIANAYQQSYANINTPLQKAVQAVEANKVERRQKRIEEAQQKDDPRRRASLENIIQTKKRENDQKIWELELERDQVASTPEQRKPYDDQINALKNDPVLSELQTRLNDLYDAQYLALQAKPDFKANSDYRDPGNIPVGTSVKDRQAINIARRINGYTAEEDGKAKSRAIEYTGDDPYLKTITTKDYLDHLDKDQKATFNYLMNTRGLDSAIQYISDIAPSLMEKEGESKRSEIAEYAKEHPFRASIESIPTNVAKAGSAVAGIADYAINRNINPNAWYNTPVTLVDTTRSAVGQDIAKNVANHFVEQGMSEKWAKRFGNAGNWLYGIGMSMADSAFNAWLGSAVSGANALNAYSSAEEIARATKAAETFTRTIMAMEATPSAVFEAKERGLSDEQAMTLGLVAGFAEYATEKWSVENLFSDKWEKNTVLAWVKQILSEGGEEGASNLINTYTDFIVSKDKSEWSQTIKENEKNGLSHKDAVVATFLKFAGEFGLDFLGGVLSGGGMGVGRVVGGAYHNLVQVPTHTKIASADKKNNTAVMQTVDTALADLINRPDTEWASGLADIANQFRGTVKGNTMNSVRDYIRETARNQADAVDKAAYTALADYLTPYTNQDGKKVDNRNAVWQLAEERNGTAKQTAQTETAPEQTAPSTETAEPSTEPSTAEAAPSTESTTATETEPVRQATARERREEARRQKRIAQIQNQLDRNPNASVDAQTMALQDELRTLQEESERFTDSLEGYEGDYEAEEKTEPLSWAERHRQLRHSDQAADQQTQTEQAVSVEQQTAPETQTLTQAQAAPQNVFQTSENAPAAENAVETENNTVAENEAQRGSTEATEDALQNEPGYRPSERRIGASALSLSEDLSPEDAAVEILKRIGRNTRDVTSLMQRGVTKTAIDALNRTVNNAIQNGQYAEEEVDALKSYTDKVRDALRNNNTTLQKKVNALSYGLKRLGIENVVVDETMTTERGKHKGNTIYISPYLDTMQSIASVVAHEAFHQARDGNRKNAKLLDDIDKYYSALASRAQDEVDNEGNARTDANGNPVQFSISDTGGKVRLYSDADFVRTYADMLMDDFGLTDEGYEALNAYGAEHKDADIKEAVAAVFESDPEKFWSYWKESADGETARDYIREEKAANFIEQLAGTDGGALFGELLRDDRNLAQRIVDMIRSFLRLPPKERRFSETEAYQKLVDKFEKALADASGEEVQRADATPATANDIPQSDSFKMSRPVERVGDLIAVHNLTEDKYLSSHKLGGFPAPSIAVVKAKTGHENYGPISVVFGSDTIDPQKDSRNRIFGGDAWTPMFPGVDYDYNISDIENLEEAIYKLSQRSGTGKMFVSPGVIRTLFNEIIHFGDSPESALETLSLHRAVQAAYVAVQGKKLTSTDKFKAYEELDRKAPLSEVKEWLRPVVEKMAGEGMLTVGGERVPLTAENVVRAMYENRGSRGIDIYEADANGLRSMAAPEYQSIDEVRENKNKLKRLDDKEYQKIVRRLDGYIGSIMDEMREFNGDRSGLDYDKAILDALRNGGTEENIRDAFEDAGIGINNKLTRDVRVIYNLASQLPTDYFEAKPERVVGFDEVMYYIIPNDIAPSTAEMMENDGATVLGYTAGDEKERLKVLNSLKNARFSREINTEQTETEAFKRWFGDWQNDPENASKVVNEDGTPKIVYHGTARGDRVGNVFLPERATSGPMAYFTDSEQIASNYARDKADTSLAYDEDHDGSYESQFRVQDKDRSIRLVDAWNRLKMRDRLAIREAVKHVTWDEDMENIVYDEDAQAGTGGLQDWRFRERNGNAIAALVDEWLNDGNLYGNEGDFMEAVRLAGIPEALERAGLGEAYYDDPNFRDEKVYGVYLNIRNPLVTTELDESFADALEEWWDEQDEDAYRREYNRADEWDKNRWDMYDWIDLLRSDIENGTTHVWTSIPDAVTDFLKSEGYDGIEDQGGKFHDEGHTVYIPFESTQIKSATDNIGTFDPNNPDIRYSREITPEQDAEYMEAVESGDTEKQQQMVDEAAMRTGYDIKAYHGTGNNFTVFDSKRVGKNYNGYSKYGMGFYFSSSQEAANEWGKNRKVMDVYLKLENPYEMPIIVTDGVLFDEYNRMLAKKKQPRVEEIEAPYLIQMLNGLKNDRGYTTKVLQKNGYDGIVVKYLEAPSEGMRTVMSGTKEYIVFDESNIKSADPVTYDNNGNPIPLSERFNPENNDIRYSRAVGEDFDEEIDSAQAITSAKTSIKQIPALFKNSNVKFGDTNVDIGGGRFDLATNYLREQGTENYIFDPFNRSDEENTRTLDLIRNGGADTATCANVLNVIAEPGARQNVILETAKSIKPDGTAYFMVYEGDGSGVGKETSSGWQNNRKTADYVDEISEYFDDVERKGKLIIAKDPKADLPKANWETSPGNSVRFSREMDNEYMDAVESGDEETQERIIREAANQAGYTSPKLFHGTDAFGFTRIDNTAPGADGFSFWAASRADMSGTYTQYAKTRKVGSEISDEEYDAAIDEVNQNIDDALDHFRGLIDRTFSEWYFGRGDDGLRETFDNANPEAGNGDGIYDEFESIVADAFYQYKDELGTDLDYDKWIEETDKGQALIDAVVDLEALRSKIDQLENGEMRGGIYELYANTDNMYELDAKGAPWKGLHPEGLPDIGRPYKTRDVANWARDNGYDGVIFRNIRDNGQYGRTEAGDVYAFFKPQSQVKSADPVTYDDNGNVIPPSQRFNPERSDIRESRDIETASNADLRLMLRESEEKIDYLKKQWTSRTAFGAAQAVRPEDFNKQVRRLKDMMKYSVVTTEEIRKGLRELYDIMERPLKGRNDTAEARWNEAAAKAEELANEWASAAAVERVINPDIVDNFETMKEIYAKLRGYSGFYVIPNVTADAGSKENFKRVRKQLSFMRLLGVESNKAGVASGRMSVDSIYTNLSRNFPGFFKPESELSDGELNGDYAKLEAIAKVAGLAWEAVHDPYSVEQTMDEETVKTQLKDDLLHSFFDSAVPTKASSRPTENDAREAYAQGQAELGAVAESERAEGYREGYNKAKFEDEGAVEAAHMREDLMEQRFAEDAERFQNTMRKMLNEREEKINRLEKRLVKRGWMDRARVERNGVMRNLNKLNRLLENPTRKQHIPQGLRASTAKLLESVGNTRLPNGKTVLTERMQQIQADEMKKMRDFAHEIQIGLTGAASAENSNRIASTEGFLLQLADKINALEDYYNRAVGPDVDMSLRTDDVAVTQNYGFLHSLNQILTMAVHAMDDANQFTIQGKNYTAENLGSLLVGDLNGRESEGYGRQKRKFAANLSDKLRDMTYETMSADLFFGMMGDNWKNIVAHSYRAGQNRQAQHEHQFVEYMKELLGDYDNMNAKRELIQINANGKPLNVTRSQLMQLYATYQRPAGRTHLENGGACFVDDRGNESRAYTVKITPEKFAELTSNLTEEDKRIADGLVKFMADECSEWGNDASMYMYGFRMYEDGSYIPLDVVNYAIPKEIADKIQKTKSIENASFTNPLKRNSTVPLRMTDIFDITNNHVRRMAAYNAYAPITNDMNRIMKLSDVSGTVQEKMGRRGYKYLQDFVQTVAANEVRNGEMAESAAPLTTAMNLYKRQAVAWNVSTMLKQPISIFRAANEIDGKYLRQGFAMNRDEYKRIRDTMLANSGVAYLKDNGYSDVGLGKTMEKLYTKDYINDSGLLRSSLADSKLGRGAITAYDWMTDKGMAGAGRADEATWVRIWKACELEVAEKHPGITADEKLRLVTQRFNDVIGKTQVVDTILDTAPLMRNKAMQIFTPFMNEPTKSLGGLVAAADAVRNGRTGAKKALHKAVGLYALSNLLIEPLITSLVSMWRDEKDDTDGFLWSLLEKMFGIKRDEDGDGKNDTTFGSVFTSNVAKGFFSFPLINIAYDTISNAIQGFGSEKIDVAALSNLVSSSVALASNMAKEPDERPKTMYRLWGDWVESAAAAMGIPLKTMRRQVAGVLRGVMDITNSDWAKWQYNKLYYNLENGTARSQKNFYDILASAYKRGDTETYERMRKELSDIVTGSSTLVDPKTIAQNIERRGGNVQPGDPLWNVEVQARFRLDTPVKGWKNENFLTGVYKQAEAAGIKDDECKKVLYSLPDKYEYEDEEGDDIEMSPAEYDQFASDCGDLAYKLVSQLSSTSNAKAWSALTIDQQLYAIEKAYDYSKRKFRKDINPELNITGMGKKLVAVYETAPMDTSKIIAAVMDMAAGYKGEKDRKKK